MTHIASPNKYPTKKAFKKAVADGEHVFLSDPSLFNPIHGEVRDVLAALERINGSSVSFVVTNHPKRSWFAEVRRNARTGSIMVI